MNMSLKRLKEIIADEYVKAVNEVDDVSEGQLKRFKVYVSGESKPFIVGGKNEKEAKQIAYAMIRNSSVKIVKVVKEGKLNEFNKAHFLNLIKQELESKKGQLAYAEDKIRYHMTPKWERKEWLEVAKDLKKEIKILATRVKTVSKMKEGKITEGFDLKKLEDAIKMFQQKIAKQGNVTNARDEEHLKQLIKVYKQMGGRKIKEGTLSEAKETIFDVAAKVMKDSQMHVYQSKRGKVKVDMQTANLLMKVFKKVNPKMKQILTKLGDDNPAQLVQTLWAVVK